VCSGTTWRSSSHCVLTCAMSAVHGPHTSAVNSLLPLADRSTGMRRSLSNSDGTQSSPLSVKSYVASGIDTLGAAPWLPRVNRREIIFLFLGQLDDFFFFFFFFFHFFFSDFFLNSNVQKDTLVRIRLHL
jgi:hypothetical protein